MTEMKYMFYRFNKCLSYHILSNSKLSMVNILKTSILENYLERQKMELSG